MLSSHEELMQISVRLFKQPLKTVHILGFSALTATDQLLIITAIGVCVCVCVCVCACDVCVYVCYVCYVCLCLCVCVCLCECVCVCVLCSYADVCVYVCLYSCSYICIYFNQSIVILLIFIHRSTNSGCRRCKHSSRQVCHHSTVVIVVHIAN